ncbi:AAA family ATPase [Muricauda sp. HICW]|uniref:AAA family ATPase n=1 Tax=Flagellimonas chongwuensis TaxID=2697365 RepID=A0A850NC40_9FLAO|nr:AAA family ATPase [Allomuricauda chongwuensis]NVN17479.1 AAA family ATPase [Allomuricauda chongwuensis]
MLEIQLPIPWENKKIEFEKIPNLMFLVGPNGSGKTRFAEELSQHLPNCRTLSADRLSGMSANHKGYDTIFGDDRFEKGFNKEQFGQYITSSTKLGYGIDAFVLLEEKYDLRIQIEATLSQLLNREIRMEWDSGRLQPIAYNRDTEKSYKLHKEECHGIKELLILLTHLYDDKYESLIIDEPELNLHPQFQSYLIQEIRRVVKNEKYRKKNVVLITHSPFILDIKSLEDLKAIVSFNTKFDVPSHLMNLEYEKLVQFENLISQLNVHHKQLFFADSPIFVEGIFDAIFFQSIQNKRGVSFEGAGSCIIDVGGNNQIVNYFYLSEYLGKHSYYIFDLDSLFTYKLRKGADTSDLIKDYLSSIGAGENFQSAVSDLERSLKQHIEKIRDNEVPESLSELKRFIERSLAENNSDSWRKARIAFLIQLNTNKDSFQDFIENRSLIFIKSKIDSLISSLKKNQVYLLENGALENYFPSYQGNKYKIQEDLKRKTLEDELQIITQLNDSELKSRYNGLYEILLDFPSSSKIDYKVQIKNLLSDLIFNIQKGANNKSFNSKESIINYLGNEWKAISRVLEIESFEIKAVGYSCKLKIFDNWELGEIIYEFNQDTNPSKIEM